MESTKLLERTGGNSVTNWLYQRHIYLIDVLVCDIYFYVQQSIQWL